MVAKIEIVLDGKDVLQSPILQSVTDAESANLQNYKGDLADLSVYFVVVNNEYGEQNEIELVEGGRDIQVTNSNVINYIYKVAHHRLNSQIREQSEHFLHGFQQLIKPEWIGMFNEQELQILISGSQEGMDVNDLRNNVHYAGGYDAKHPVIEKFWEVVQTLDSDLQRKFLK
jgi:ubiquitin-protein ligase E3 C